VPQSGRRQGHAQVAEFFRLLGEGTEFKTFEPREFIEQGATVVVLGSYTAVVKSTGRDFGADWVMIFRFRDSKVAAFKELTDSAALNDAYLQRATA
jgi:hypothetical protein